MSTASELNEILTKYEPTGANKTARQDGLAQKGIVGIPASRKMAEADEDKFTKYKDRFIQIGVEFNLPPALLAAIASRESRMGRVLKNGWGDSHRAFGIMQIDKRSHKIKGTDPAGLEHIRQATGILQDFKEAMERKHPSWSEERQLQGAVAAYNCGPGNVDTLEGMDKGTTGDDYSNDVWARAQYFVEKMV